MTDETKRIEERIIAVHRGTEGFPAFLNERLGEYKALEMASTHPSFVIFGNNCIVRICAEPDAVDGYAGSAEGRKLVFTYRLPEDELLIKDRIIPLSRQYFGGMGIRG